MDSKIKEKISQFIKDREFVKNSFGIEVYRDNDRGVHKFSVKPMLEDFSDYILADMYEYTLSLRKELEEAKAKIAELEKEVQIKQTAIDALLDHEF